MQEYLTLIENSRSEVMSRAAELREEGYDPSSALAEAWDEIRELDNPEEFDDDEVEVAEVSRRNPRTKPSQLTGMWALLLAGAGYFIWCAVASKGGTWSWQPWKSLGRRLPVARPRPQLDRHYTDPRVKPGFENIQIW